MKKAVAACVGFATIFMMAGGPALAIAAPTVSSVTVTEKYISVVFDQNVVNTTNSENSDWGASASSLNNFSFESPTGTSEIISRYAPYSNFTDYYVSGSTDGVLNIFGLDLTAGQSYTLGIQNIASVDNVSLVMDGIHPTGTVASSSAPVINKIENITSGADCYGYPCSKIGDGNQIRITGSNFNTESSGVIVDIGGVLHTVTPSSADAIVMTLGTGGESENQTAPIGNNEVKVKNQDDKLYSNVKYFGMYNDIAGVIIGKLTNSSATVGSDQNNVPVRIEYWNTEYGSTESHNNGYYAVVGYNNGSCVSGSVDVFFTTPAGASEAAPTEAGGQTIEGATVTDAGTSAFAASNISGIITDPSSNAIEGATVIVHNDYWSTIQRAITNSSGAYKVYVPMTSSSNYYGVEVQPPEYNPNNYRFNEAWYTIALGGSTTSANLSLTQLNVQGTVKTPAGDASDSNPSPDTVVPNAHLNIHTTDWTVNKWTDTDTSGVFYFGGVTAGSYVMEVEPNWGDSTFGGYSRVSYSVVIGSSNVDAYNAETGITNLDNDANGIATGGAIRLGVPNVFGTVLAGGEAVSGAWVNLNKDSYWSGTNTDSNGKFRFSVSQSGTYHLNVDSNSSSYSNYSADVAISDTEVTNGKDIGNINLSAPNVTGKVYDPTGTTGQQNISIDICPYMSPGTCYWGQTDSNGNFGIGTVPDGTWQMQLNVYSSGVYAAPAAIILVVSGGSVTSVSGGADDLNDIRLADPSVNGLVGVVYGPTGSVGQQANLGIRQQNSMTGNDSWANTNESGQFAFGTVSAGTYELEVNPNWGSSYSRKMYTITVDADGNVTSDDSGFTAVSTRNIIVRLSQPNITGTLKTPVWDSSYSTLGITQGECDQPVAWGWINIYQAGMCTNGICKNYGANTNDSGVFSLGGVEAGTYIIEYQAGWGSPFSTAREEITISSAVASGSESLNLNTTSSKANAGAIRLGLPQLRGTVVKADGSTPVSNVWINVYSSSNWNIQPAGSNTNSNGKFSIGGLDDGTYNIEVNMPWGEGLVAPSGLSVEISNDIGVVKEDGENLTNNKITLQEPTNTISGHVYKDTNSNGEYDSGTDTVVTNARVETHKDMGGGFVETRTNASGAYSLKVADGSWWVEVRPDWGTEIDWLFSETPTRMTFSAVDDSDDTQTKNFKVAATNSTIYGYVKKTDGTAVSNCWVDICQDMGMCNGRSTDSNGRFSIKVAAGTYRVSAFPSGDLMNTFGAPNKKIVTVNANSSADAGTLTLKAKNSHIKGKVQDAAGNGIQNVVINVYEYDGPGWGMGYTDTSGDYDVTVPAGMWGLMAMPMSNQYVYQGAPLSVTIDASETSENNDFILKTANATIKGKVRLNSASGDVVTDFWGGVWIKDTSVDDYLDFGGPMDDMMEKSGMMAGGTGGTGSVMGPGMMDQGMGSGINNGGFQLKVPAGTYEIGVGSPPGSSYTLSETATVTVLSDSDSNNALGYTEVNLIVVENDATVSGRFFLDANSNDIYDSGEEVSNLRAMVNADRIGGGWQSTESNSDGSYSLNVAAGTWYVDAFIDPFMTFGQSYYMIVSPDEKIAIESGSSNTLNFEVKQLNAVISGQVLDATGTSSSAMSGVWVFADYGSADMLTEFNGVGGPGVGDYTDVSGNYSINVSEGTYKIGVGLPPWDTRDLIAPEFLTVIVEADEISTGNDLTFTAADATIAGTVFVDADADGAYDSGEAQASYVRAWSDDGRGNGASATSGSYSIKVNNGTTWHLVAVAQISSILYESEVVTIAVDEETETQNLELVSLGLVIPESKTISFDSSESKTLTLTNGLTLEMPAGSIATSGTVTVSVTPTVDVKPDAKEKPIGITYSFNARNSDGQEISDLAGNVTITMPYNEELIEAAGYSEYSITPKYYNETTGTWENYDTVMRDPENNLLIIITDHFSEGGPVGEGGVPTAPSGLSASSASTSSIALSWTDNSDDETGFKVYRNSADSSWESAALITTTSANATSATDTGLSASTTYYYRVKATNASGDSSWTSTASATTNSDGGSGAGASGSALPFTQTTTEEEEESDETTDETADETDTEDLITFEKPISEMTIEELQAKIAEIIAAIQELQAELAELNVIEGCSITAFDRHLSQGMSGDDVECLQIVLNSDSATQVASTGAGSPGSETDYFGPLTKSAVIKFQNKYADEVLAYWGLTSGTGYVGDTTIAKLNQLLSVE